LSGRVLNRLALVGFGVALYLALYQWRVSDTAWEPFFGDGSRHTPNSGVLAPPARAGRGARAFGYLADAVTGVIGGRSRSARSGR
jgi:hypothetical protein